MALSGILFVCWRFFELVMLVPIVGMLGWFVSRFNAANQLTPTFILVLFIVSTLALAWTFFTLIQYYRARHDALFVAFVDLLFVGGLIGGVVVMRGVAGSNCIAHLGSRIYVNDSGTLTVYGPNVSINKSCAMLKASFALGIICTVLFFVTFLLALLVHRHHRDDDRVVVKREVVHTTRRNHHRSSSRDHRGSRDHSRDYSRDYSSRPRTGSRSQYTSSRRTYV